MRFWHADRVTKNGAEPLAWNLPGNWVDAATLMQASAPGSVETVKFHDARTRPDQIIPDAPLVIDGQ